MSNKSRSVCVCSNEAISVRLDIVPKKLGEIPLTVVAKDIDSSMCDEGVEQLALGVTDAVTRKLLVEVQLVIFFYLILPYTVSMNYTEVVIVNYKSGDSSLTRGADLSNDISLPDSDALNVIASLSWSLFSDYNGIFFKIHP